MNRIHSCAAVACAVALFTTALVPSRSFAANYAENVDGDLPSQNPINLITLDPGVNTVSGTFGNLGFPTDHDSFAFTIAGGLKLSGGVVQVTDNVGNIGSVTWEVRTGAVAGAGVIKEEIFALSPGSDAFGDRPAGTYHIGAVSFGFFEVGRADYTFSLRVEAVPEPATLALLALAPLALIRRRKRSARRG